jgi:hypothetical protein
LTDILGQLRGAGLREVVGPDPLLRAQVADTVLDEFLSVAVRDLSDRVIFGLALSLPACIIQRGVGQEALQYCLDHRNLTPAEVTSVWDRMARPGGPSESLRAAHRRIATVVLHAGRVELSYRYYQFLRDNIGQLVRECPEELADVMLDPKFSAGGTGLDSLVLAIEYSADPEPYVRRWIDWIEEGRFDSAGPDHGNCQVMYSYLQDHPVDPQFAVIRTAAHIHLVQLVKSPEKVNEAWHNLRGMFEARYAFAGEALAAISRSGIQLDDLESGPLRYPVGAVRYLAADRTGGHSTQFGDWLTLLAQHGPPNPPPPS